MDMQVTQGEPYYCDMGAHEGMYGVAIRGVIYLTPEEREQYLLAGQGEFRIGLPERGEAARAPEEAKPLTLTYAEHAEGHAEWQAQHDDLWRRYIRRELDGDEYCKMSLALGADPDGVSRDRPGN